MSEPNERQYWLWVTRPDFYLDEDGNLTLSHNTITPPISPSVFDDAIH